MTNNQLFQNILSNADIKINGPRDWDIQIHDEQVYDRVLKDGSLGFGESYMDGQWDCNSIDEMINRIVSAKIDKQFDLSTKIQIGLQSGKANLAHLLNRQHIKRAAKDVSSHYDLGNDLFKSMLDKRMTYTCAYWKNADDLDSAQEAKLDLICRKMDLKPGMRLLDIGCGWGSFMIYAAEKYGVICDGITLSKEQALLGKNLVDEKGLDVNFILKDYRLYKPDQLYDRIVSVGMMEHVGPTNYNDYFKASYNFLADDGIFLLHTIGNPESTSRTDPWINKYIFPNGVIPSMQQIGKAAEDFFNIEDVQNIGPDYDKTLMAWHDKFEQNWMTISDKYDERFHRMWDYYLLTCAGSFRSRSLNVWQFGLTKRGTQLPSSLRIS